jgi:hypothetical protein
MTIGPKMAFILRVYHMPTLRAPGTKNVIAKWWTLAS